MSRPSLLTLIRWLGPWAGSSAAPFVRRSPLAIDPSRGYRAYLYEPARTAPAGAYLVAPGLHYAGPDDERLDRFCRALAASGILVLAPFLPDFTALCVRDTTADDLALAFDKLEDEVAARRLPRPGVFSISFGSSPAIDIAARPSHRDRIGELVLFGGYADFDVAVRFAVTGRSSGGAPPREDRDPLNSPVVFLNLLPWLEASGDADTLAGALRSIVERTWGRKEMKRPGARDLIANEIAASLPPEQRGLFLEACGLRPGADERLERALFRSGAAFRFADPRPHLGALRAPVVIVHGRDDDVIPWTEAEKIRRALPPGHPHEVHLTGMYGHTGAMLPRPAEVAREALTLLNLVRAIRRASGGG